MQFQVKKSLLGYIKKEKGYAEANVSKVLEESPFAQKAKCNHYYICSKIQNLSYDKQILEKSNQVEDAFRRLGGFSNFKLADIVKSDSIFNYRNKMEFASHQTDGYLKTSRQMWINHLHWAYI